MKFEKIKCPVCGGVIMEATKNYVTVIQHNSGAGNIQNPVMVVPCSKCKAEIGVWSLTTK